MSSVPRIPFYRASLRGRELEYVAEVARSGQTGGAGVFGQRCEALLEGALGGGCRVLLTTSGTHALEMAALLLRLEPGDEVLVPSFSFATTAGAFVQHGGRPVFVDIREDTLNLDEAAVEAGIGPRTRALVPVHYGGVPCAMDALVELSRRHRFTLVEDNAHGLFGRFEDRSLGTIAPLAALSFQQTKNFIAGEGGALVINDPELVPRGEILREKGTDRSSFMRGESDRYDWVDVGSSYVLSDLLAAFLLAQLEDREAVQQERRDLWATYERELAAWAGACGVRLPTVPGNCEPSWHTYWLLMPDAAARDGLIATLRGRGIHAVFHYTPLHTSPMGRRFGARPGDCPVTERVAATIVRLPFFNAMDEGMCEEILAAVTQFRP